MRSGSFVSIGCATFLAAALAACGGGGGSSALPYSGTGTGTGTGSLAPGSTNFSGLSGAPMAIGEKRAFSPSEAGYAGVFSATSSAPDVLAVTPASGNGPFMVTAQKAGTGMVTVTDGAGRTSTQSITVGSLGFGSLSNAPLTIGEQRSFTPSEPGYSGAFTVTSANPAIIAVSPASGSGPFTLTGAAAGTTTITVADAAGHSMPLDLTVAASGGSVQPTNAPTSAPTASPSTAPIGTPTTGPTSTPTSAPTTAPTGAPTTGPTSAPTTSPTTVPTGTPTTGPTSTPTTGPTSAPTTVPTTAPTTVPTTAPTTVPTTAPTTAPTAAPISLAPASLSVGLGQLGTVSATDNRGSALGTPIVGNPAIATIVANGNGSYEVSGNAAGSTSITFTDGLGNTVSLPVTVPAAPAPVININPAGLNGGVIGIGANVLTLMPTEAGYFGTFTATSSNAAIAAVLQVPLTNTFAVTTATPGSAIITVRDTNGNSASIGFTVQ